MTALRQWSADQQVALLFVVLFGLLTLLGIVVLLRSLREDAADPTAAVTPRRSRAPLHSVRALWVGAVVFWAAWMSGPVGATLLFGSVSFLALREYVTLLKTRRGDHRGLVLAFFVVLPLQYVLVAYRQVELFAVLIPVYTFLAIPVLSALAGDAEHFLERNAGIQWGLAVCVYGLSHAPALLLTLPGGRGAFVLFFLVMVTLGAQIAQALAAQRLDRRAAATLAAGGGSEHGTDAPTQSEGAAAEPVRAVHTLADWSQWATGRLPAARIDQGFSPAAWGAGVGAAAVVGLALFWITPFGPAAAAALAAIAGGSGTLGELVMQALKKDVGVRAWGVTGAVGLLDRVAPLCFGAPVFFHTQRWFQAVSAG